MAEVYLSKALEGDNAKKALTVDPTSGYYTHPVGFSEYLVKNMPLFTLWSARMMITDPVVKFALAVRDAAVSAAEVVIESSSPEIGTFLREQWETLWGQNQNMLLKAKRWGYGAYQVNYEEDAGTGNLAITGLKDFAPQDVRFIRIGGRPAGFRVSNRHAWASDVKGSTAQYYLKFPRALWLPYDNEYGSMYGRSVLRNAYTPWWEKWMNHGAKKAQQMRMIKDAYPQLVGWYDQNEHVRLPDGTEVTSQNVMRSLLANLMTAGTMTLPSNTNDEGNRKWDVTRVPDAGDPSRMFRWTEELNEDIFKAMCVPSEIVAAASSGSGYSGRSIPLAVFLQSCQQEFNDYLKAINQQVLRPLCLMNFGSADYKLSAEALLETFTRLMSDEMGGRGIGGADSRSGVNDYSSQPNSNPEAKLAKTGQIEKRGDASVLGDTGKSTVTTLEKQRKVKQMSEESLESLSAILIKKLLDDMLAEIDRVTKVYPVYDIRVQEEVKSIVVKYTRLAGEQLAASSFSSYLEGTAIAASMVDKFMAKTGRYFGAENNVTLAQAADIFESGLEITGRTIRSLSVSPVVSGRDFLETAEAVRDGAFAMTGNYAEDTLLDIRNILKTVIKEGGTSTDFASRVRAAVEDGEVSLSESYLDMVFRTNVFSYHSDGMEAGLSNPQVSTAFPFRRYRATKDDRVRPEHMALEENGLDSTAIYEADSEVWKTFRPPWDFNCFLPDTVVQGNFNLASRMWYSGEIVEITTRSGNRLRVTVNHPVLTEGGFIPAGSLTNGQDVLSYGFRAVNRLGPDGFSESAVRPNGPNNTILTPPYPYKQHSPTRIDEVFSAFENLASTFGVPVGPDDFYGDAKFGNGDVDIVAINWELLNSIYSQTDDRLEDFGLTSMNKPESLKSRLGSLNKFFPGFLSPGGGAPSGTALTHNSSPVMLEAAPFEFLSLGPASRLNTSRYKTGSHSTSGDAELFSDLILGSSSLIQRDQVTELRFSHYDGHVYDLQSRDGYIISQNIVTSNCRCTWAPITVREAARLGVGRAKAWMDRAAEVAAQRGGEPENYLRETQPTTLSSQLWPTYQGRRIEPNPAFARM